MSEVGQLATQHSVQFLLVVVVYYFSELVIGIEMMTWKNISYPVRYILLLTINALEMSQFAFIGSKHSAEWGNFGESGAEEQTKLNGHPNVPADSVQ